jgi:hypothetical protein
MLRLSHIFFALTCSLFFSSSLYASTIQSLEGFGLDDKPCSAVIVRDGNTLISVQLKGSAEIFQILSENGSSYGPKTYIDPRGAEEVFSITGHGNDHLYRYFRFSENLFSNGETFKLNTDDLQKTTGKELKGIKVLIQLSLDYDEDKVVRVTAQSKAKALMFATLGSVEFICKAK